MAQPKSTLQWITQIPCTVTEPDVAALEAKFRVKLPAALRALFLDHSGHQVQPSIFYAQSTRTGKYRKESLGFIYPASRPEDARKEVENEREGNAEASYNAEVVNEMFRDVMNEREDDRLDADAPAPQAAAAASSSSSSAAAPSSTPSIPFFAFSESPLSGHLIALDTRTQAVMLLDVTQRRGPWMVAATVEEFLEKLQQGDENGPPKEGEIEEEDEEHDDAGGAFGSGDYGEDEEEDVYCCDGEGCGEELVEVRYHCEQCANYDLCAECYQKSQKSSSAAAAGGKQDPHAHPKDHTFKAIQRAGEAQDEEGEEEEEKETTVPKPTKQ